MVSNNVCLLIFLSLVVMASSSNHKLSTKYEQVLHREIRRVEHTLTRNRRWIPGFQNIRFMCGIVLLPYEVPVGWLLTDGPYGKSNQTLYERRYKLVPVCCAGYKRNEDDICVPACKGGCRNGWCLRPNVCDCSHEDMLNSLGHCVPCSCEHGSCTGGACVCDDKYELDPQTLTCKPVCDYPCYNGDCVAPNTCECNPGYKLSLHISNFCIPHCKNKCDHGQCTAPDVCICNTGYYLDELGDCLPQCDNCQNGYCMHPNVCDCKMGFKKVEGVCVPTCEGLCVNGFCSPNDVCVCHSGYENYNKYICMPTCSPACIHGLCMAPNQCECEEGYVVTSSDPSRCEPAGGANDIDDVLANIRYRVQGAK